MVELRGPYWVPGIWTLVSHVQGMHSIVLLLWLWQYLLIFTCRCLAFSQCFSERKLKYWTISFRTRHMATVFTKTSLISQYYAICIHIVLCKIPVMILYFIEEEIKSKSNLLAATQKYSSKRTALSTLNCVNFQCLILCIFIFLWYLMHWHYSEFSEILHKLFLADIFIKLFSMDP